MVARMKLTRISKYGFQVNNNPEWHNYDEKIPEDKRLSRNDMGKNIEYRKNSAGKVVQTVILKEDKNKPKVTVKVIESDDPSMWEREINDFSRKCNVIATQTLVKENKYVAVIYYESEL